MTTLSARDKILGLFRKAADGFLSGSSISRELGVTRAAVWKQIEILRSLGYRIEAVPSRGYRLLSGPDEPIPEELQHDLGCRIIGRRFVYFGITDSTNRQACLLGEQGAPEGSVVIADQQSAGKGRLGRQWTSPPGVNLYTSILLRPAVLPWDAPQLTFLSAVAVCRAITEVSGLQAAVKWPNDILLHGKKVAGLLNEMSSETDGVNFVVLGIGVNLNMRIDQFPAELRYPATSLMLETGQSVSRVDYARALLRHLDALYLDFLEHGPGPIMAAWTELCEMQGCRVVVDCQGRTITGLVQGLDEDGALLVETASGQIERILAGDVRPA